jgi:hypothetical protein
VASLESIQLFVTMSRTCHGRNVFVGGIILSNNLGLGTAKESILKFAHTSLDGYPLRCWCGVARVVVAGCATLLG